MPRLLYRTRHIFILAAALVQISLGIYVRAHIFLPGRVVQWAGSLLVTAATGLFLTGFVLEPGRTDLHTPYSHWATYAMVAGVGMHAIAVLRSKLDTRTAERRTII